MRLSHTYLYCLVLDSNKEAHDSSLNTKDDLTCDVADSAFGSTSPTTDQVQLIRYADVT